MIMATGGLPPLELVVTTLLGGALMAGGANAMNCYLDRELDMKMSRTRSRPVPAQRVPPARAFIFALALAFGAFLLLTRAVNWLSAVLSLAGFLIYVIFYTGWLKRTSPSAVLVGGFAGAIPPLVGWAAVTGRVELHALDLFAVIVFWQIPHTWALTLMLHNDYSRAERPQISVEFILTLSREAVCHV
jgi:heme o synthase